MKRMPSEEAFQALLDGATPQGDAGGELRSLAALASALAPADRAAPDPRFRARLRKELVAAATAIEEAEIAAFATVLEDTRAAAPAGMRALVKVASALEPDRLPTPAPSFRYQLRHALLTQAEAGPSLAARAAARAKAINDRMRRSLRIVTATGMAAVVLAGSSASLAAARTSLPVDALYPLKRFSEAAQLAARAGTEKGFLYLDLARERLDEVRGMTRRGVRAAPPYATTFDRMDVQTNRGAELILTAFRADDTPRGSVDRLVRFAHVQLQDLQGLLDRLPPAVLPQARDSLIVAAQVAQRAETILAGCEVCPANPLVRPVARGDGTQAPVACACEAPSRSETGSPRAPQDRTGGSTPTTPSGGGGDDAPAPEKKRVDLPDVPSTDIDETAEDILNDLLDQVAPETSLPPAPEPTLVPTLEPVPAPSLTAPSADTLDEQPLAVAAPTAPVLALPH